MALPILHNIRVYTLSPDAITVEWEIEPTTLDLAQYAVEVLRSESEAGPYVSVSLPMSAGDVFDFRDAGVNILSKWRTFYYRIRVSSKTSPSDYCDFGSTGWKQTLAGADAGGVVMEAPPDLYALESIRRFELVLREFGGRRVLAAIERSWGQRCPQCWDALKRRRTMSGCLTCFDTGLLGGFFQPMETWAMKPPHPVMQQITPLFELQADDRLMWFSRYPRLKPQDLIMSVDGDRFRVIKIDRSEKAWALTRQTVQLRRLSRDQVEYQIPVSQADWGRNNLTVGALREHVRSTDIDSYRKAVQGRGLSSETLFPVVSEFATTVEGSNAESD